MTKEEFWQAFLTTTGKDGSTKYADSFHFGSTERMANVLLALVLEGKKRATASSVLAFEAEKLDIPKVGNYSIVTDWAGEPRCVIETTDVMILPFNQMTFDICKREGEDDCLESWVEGHRRFFKMDAEELGYEFSEDMLVVFEDFEVAFSV